MGQAAKRRLDAAGDDGDAGEGFPRPLAIDERGPVRPQADAAAGGIGVVVADFLVGGVVVDERVHVPRAYREEETGTAELPPGFAGLPQRLAQDGDAEPRAFEHAVQDRHGEAGVVDVGVAGDEDDVDGVPAAFAHLRSGRGRVRTRLSLGDERQRHARRRDWRRRGHIWEIGIPYLRVRGRVRSNLDIITRS